MLPSTRLVKSHIGLRNKKFELIEQASKGENRSLNLILSDIEEG